MDQGLGTGPSSYSTSPGSIERLGEMSKDILNVSMLLSRGGKVPGAPKMGPKLAPAGTGDVAAVASPTTGTIPVAGVAAIVLNSQSNNEIKPTESQKPKYENPGHHDPSGGPLNYNPKKSVLPKNHKELWGKSFSVDGSKKRWTVEGTGKKAVFHQFNPDGKGSTYHWSGSTSGVSQSGKPTPIKPQDVPQRVRNKVTRLELKTQTYDSQ